jgi:hypothetical protein
VLIGKLNRGNNLQFTWWNIPSTESVDQAAARLLTECTQKRATSEPVQYFFGETNRIISSLHKELIIRVYEKYKMK